MTILVSALREFEPYDNTPTSQRLYELARSAQGETGKNSRLNLSGVDRDIFATYVQALQSASPAHQRRVSVRSPLHGSSRLHRGARPPPTSKGDECLARMVFR